MVTADMIQDVAAGWRSLKTSWFAGNAGAVLTFVVDSSSQPALVMSRWAATLLRRSLHGPFGAVAATRGLGQAISFTRRAQAGADASCEAPDKRQKALRPREQTPVAFRGAENSASTDKRFPRARHD